MKTVHIAMSADLIHPGYLGQVSGDWKLSRYREATQGSSLVGKWARKAHSATPRGVASAL